jgi:3-methylcrotonyl-CoA carboxylase beta subunit
VSTPRIESRIRTNTPEFQENAAAMRSAVDELRRHLEKARAGGGKDATTRHTERGKLTARDRVDGLLDPGTAFLELSSLAAHGMYEGDAPGASMVTGVGTIHGRPAVIVANDATVKGGTYYPITVKKHLRAQEIALENRLPCVYLVRRRCSPTASTSAASSSTRRACRPPASLRSRSSWGPAPLAARTCPR